MTFSLRIKSPERDAFTGSAICVGGIVRVRTSGCLTFDCDNSQNKVHSSAHSPSLPVLPSAGIFARNLRRTVQPALRSEHLSSIVVIGNTLRRLASVLLLRLSQPPRPSSAYRLVKNWCGLPITRRSVFSRCQSLQKPQRGLFDRFKVLSCPVVHVQKHEARNDGKITKAFGEFPNV